MRSQVVAVKTRRGFTLVELAVVIVIIGVLAAFGVPRFLKSVERSKAAEAFTYLSAVQSAQERYLARNGTYATKVSDLDITMPAPKYFGQPSAITASDSTWSLTLTRAGASAGFAAYTVTFKETGFDSTNSTIDPTISPMAP